MSTATEIARLQTARNTIRNKMINLGLGESTDLLDDLATEINGIENRGAVNATVKEGESYTVPAGYHNGSGTVTGVAGGGNYQLQAKSATPTKSQQSVTPDSGYYGLSGVTVAAIPAAYQDVTSVTATDDDVLATKVFVDSEGTVTVGNMANNGAISRQLNTTTTSTTIPAGYHNGSGTVSITLETKSATPTESTQTITPTSGKVLSQVTVNPIPSEYIVTSDATATAGDILEDATAYVDGELLTGTMANNGATGGTISTKAGTVTIPEGYTSGGSVSISSTEQAKIISDNIKSGVTLLGVNGSSTVVDTTVQYGASASQILEGKSAYVNGQLVEGTMPLKLPVTTKISTKSQTVQIPSGYYELGGSVSIDSTEQAKIISDNIKSGVTMLGVSGKTEVVDTTVATADAAGASHILEDKEAYVNGSLVTGTMANNGATGGTISTKAGTVTIPAGYTSGGTASIDSTEQAKIISDNIKSGVTLLGVSGSSTVVDTAISSSGAVADNILSGKKAYVDGTLLTGSMTNNGAVSATLDATTGKQSYTVPTGYHNGSGTVSITLETKSATPTTSSQDITPTSGKVLSKVTVNAIPAEYGDTTGDDAVASNLLYGKIAHTIDDGVATQITGSMPNNGSTSGTISTKDGTVNIPAGYTSGGTVSISSTEQAKIISGNIKSGVTLLGVSGSSTVVDTQVIAADTVSASEIIAGKKAYVNGELVTGTMDDNGSVSATIDGLTTTSVIIAAGYTSGGTISLTDDIEQALAAI